MKQQDRSRETPFARIPTQPKFSTGTRKFNRKPAIRFPRPISGALNLRPGSSDIYLSCRCPQIPTLLSPPTYNFCTRFSHDPSKVLSHCRFAHYLPHFTPPFNGNFCSGELQFPLPPQHLPRENQLTSSLPPRNHLLTIITIVPASTPTLVLTRTINNRQHGFRKPRTCLLHL